ncbi:cell wall anchor protein [Corynebacterium macginleyi]|uniref:Cell wall anchor protein n=1 Tax=Corynebacterium macginleyi TaxID=38290 RepID=A0A3M0G762_9CORY|nr:cell wall anchor protein [Corynebacterium macginleyi]MBK4138872.1 cell wall anchor protein [Corynebacterium macginleyi]MBK4140424.1 cell wall anchor protein [Corynebacterium macginleyi]MBK4141216.1 cell wall anchor protein [Corynebacterium macginleyi]MBK4145217.1 cell wall anchor protein [Corynebacterium macginleyi]MBK4147261.1 cell wall anchor protein [Corynebacterium macginleyi]
MSGKKHAGAFDLRNVISALLALYGFILIACYFFLDPGINADTAMPKEATDNLWAGLGMLVVAALFFVWARVKPIRIPGED